MRAARWSTIVIDLSVVIATYNRSRQLRRCLEALFAQIPPSSSCEVIVVVDGSTDDSHAMLERLVAPCPLRVVAQTNQGQPAALNRGVAMASGAICLLLDDDILAAPALISEHLRVQRDAGGVIGIGQLTLKLRAAPDQFLRYFASAWSEHYAALNQETQGPTFLDCYSGNLSVPRDAFLAVGGFATDLPRSYDIELAYRLVHDGLSLRYIPQAIAVQEYQKDFRAVLADAEREGVASVALYRRHPSMLAHLSLGAFTDESSRVLFLRRALLLLHIPVRLPALLSLRARGLDVARWYSFLYGYSYWRGVRRAARKGDLWNRLVRGTVILMYHAIGQLHEPASRYIVPRRRFARQMDWLKRGGYHILSLDDLLRRNHASLLPLPRSVALTFDDGYMDNYTDALPCLRDHGFPATIFLVSGAVGTSNNWDTTGTLMARPLVGWQEVHQLLSASIEIGAHTRTHISLPTATRTQAEGEIHGSKADLERALDRPIRAFAYPYGDFDAESEEIVTRAGFRCGCSVQPGSNGAAASGTRLRRIEIRGTDSMARFILTLWLGERGIALPHWHAPVSGASGQYGRRDKKP
jgi:peptidoglycan/xylan/chitin deacetylase (PgdA/CDA1 family)/GT2 family glycosyltransferase